MSSVTICFCQKKNWCHQTVMLYWTIIFALAVQIRLIKIYLYLSSWSCDISAYAMLVTVEINLYFWKRWIFNTHWDANYNFVCSHANSYCSFKRMTPEGEILQSTRGFNTGKNHWKKLMDFVNFPFACISTQLPLWFSGFFFLMESSFWQ